MTLPCGGLWAGKAGNNYRCFMVYERRTIDGANKPEDFINIVKHIRPAYQLRRTVAWH